MNVFRNKIPEWTFKISKILKEKNLDCAFCKELATVLGYSKSIDSTNDEDCQDVLNKCFTSHNLREATYKIWNVLATMKVTDVHSIIDNALFNKGKLLE